MDNLKELKCKYIFADQYNPKYINGAYGGINSRGEIIINFYLERMPLPKAQTYELVSGKIHQEKLEEREPEDHESSVVRMVENGIILNYNNAKEIHKWLGEHIDNLEKTKNNE